MTKTETIIGNHYPAKTLEICIWLTVFIRIPLSVFIMNCKQEKQTLAQLSYIK